jgi:hypothetical protein
MTKTLTESDLKQFTGSELWYRHGLVRNVLYTDGAKHVAEAGGAYWLLDEIALAQKFIKAVAAEEFQVWKLAVSADSSATLTCEDGNGNAVFRKKHRVHGFSAEGNHALVLQRHHPLAERVLSQFH